MKKHLHDHGMNYFEHLYHAWKFAAEMILLGLTSLIHGLVPNLYKTKGIERIHDMSAKLKLLGDKPKPKNHKWTQPTDI